MRGYEGKFENNAEFHELRAVCSISWRRRLFVHTMQFAALNKAQRILKCDMVNSVHWMHELKFVNLSLNNLYL